ncbi:MAG: hypothetical protein OXE45_14630 [bacterium]|nr:hypothetical protein [bacterium]
MRLSRAAMSAAVGVPVIAPGWAAARLGAPLRQPPGTTWVSMLNQQR